MQSSSGEEECAFCKIVKNYNEKQEEPKRQIIFEDRISIAFLDRRPVFLGHTLLIPRVHFRNFLELPKEIVRQLFCNAQTIARAIEDGLPSEGTFIAINNKVSQSVPHLHIHLIPRNSGDGLRGFFWPRQKYHSEQQMMEIATSIRRALERSIGDR